MNMDQTKKNKITLYLLTALLVVYGLACAYLYYQQSFFVKGGSFESDLPFHISMAVDDHWFYSLTAVLYQLFFLTPFGHGLTAGFLAIVTVATVYATYALLQLITEKKYSKSLMLLLAFALNVIMPAFVEWAHFQRYIGYQSASIWHNSTYTCMKLLSVLVMYFYIRYEKKYRDGLSIKEWIWFALLLVVANGIKPSFCMVFAPVMAIGLLVDLFRKVPFRQVFLFGLAVVPSLFVILWQNVVLFGNDTGNGIVINPGYTLALRGTHPKVTFLLSIAFPLFILLFTLKDLIKDKLYGFVWMMWFFSLLEVYFFTEAGKRAKDANFLWGYAIGIFFITLMALVKYLQKMKAQDGIWNIKYIKKGFLVAGGLLFVYQVGCGIYFFSQLMQGITYWM